ncbi:MAG: HD domain-containing protein, partial [Candidatus Micrarchaeota archaeon]|nr:HD domain-containing protein [Candidatus Micrarchaeota archaeon]
MAEENPESKRKGRQPEQMSKGEGYIPWIPRRGKWRAGKSTAEITRERLMQRHFELAGVTTQAQIGSQHHFFRASERLGDDEENPNVWRYHDAIHKLVTLTGAENEIDKHPLFRRLMRIKQTEAILSGYYVAASHDRHAHSLGAMHLAGRIARKLGLPQKTVAELRLAALVHDIGHTAFSHGAEPILKQKLGIDHEQLGEQRMRQEGIDKIIADHGLDFEQVMKYTHNDGLGEIVTEYADRMDYLQRDGFHVGVKPAVQRKVQLTIEKIIANLKLKDGKLCVTPKGEKALKRFADWRTLFFSQIYFYPPSMLTRYFLRKALDIGAKRKVITVNDLLEGGDEEILRKLAEAKIPEANQIHLRNTYLRFNPVFTAHFGQLKRGAVQSV